MDGQADAACTTRAVWRPRPATTPRDSGEKWCHPERREVEVTSVALALPAIVLRNVQGTLMLTSNPPGAAVLHQRQAPPAGQPGADPPGPRSYSITVQW
jgi:hypothetical protein